MTEVWRIVWRNDTYEISNIGRFRRASNGRLSTPQENGSGYYQVSMSRGGKRTLYALHRLVLEVFDSPCPHGKECNHKDGDKSNNGIDNLEWVTRSENIRHAIDTGLHYQVRGEESGKTNMTESDVIEITRRRKAGERYPSIAADFGITPESASQIARRVTWKHVQMDATA